MTTVFDFKMLNKKLYINLSFKEMNFNAKNQEIQKGDGVCILTVN